MMRVVKPGALSTLQDLGRYGYQRFGVPVNGAMDEWAHRVANLLVGNMDTAVTLEITLTGPLLNFERDTLIALTGADFSPTVNGDPIPMDRAVLVRAGAELAMPARTRGARGYLAVRGGFEADTIMGSASTFLRGGFGGRHGRALQRGDRVGILSQPSKPRGLIRLMVQSGTDFVAGPVASAPWEALLPASAAGPEVDVAPMPESNRDARAQPGDSTLTVRCMRGPQWERFDRQSLERFLGTAFHIDGQSDRMGYRLQGETLALSSPLEMVSEATSFGCVQVPPDGNPIVLMADRQSAGGYPKIAYAATVDLPLLAQAMPGERVGFAMITLEESQRLYLAREASFEALRARVHAAATFSDI
jgi:antagonist of KipI